jgi:hypothetical protein
MSIYLISEQTIKDTTILNENVDPRLIAPAIMEAQDIHIQTLIGSNLYNTVKGMIPSGVISLTANVNYKTLLDSYIQPALKYYVLAELVFPMTAKLMNKSVATRSGEFSSSISLDEVAKVTEHYKNKAEWYAQRLISYLKDNHTLFPEYLTNIPAGFSTILPKRTSYTNGMFLGDDEPTNLGFDYPR